MAWDQAVMRVSPVTYQRVTDIKTAMQDAKRRQVTYSEVLDQLVETWISAQLAAPEPGR
jgi:hypothetical protein